MKWKFKGQCRSYLHHGDYIFICKNYSMHVSSTAHLSFKGHFNNQDVPKKGKNPEIPRKAWPFYISPCWKALKQCLAKLSSESSKLQCHAQKYFPELIKIPCKRSENMLWRKEKEAEGSSMGKSKAWPGFSSLTRFTSLCVMNWTSFSLKARIPSCISQHS